ncbi:MAG: hypothetical protein WC600_03155 [Desulfobaccales bacterium]
MVKKRLTVILAVVAIALTVWPSGQKAAATEINILPYYVAGNVGDYWTYAYIAPTGVPDFTLALTQVGSGPLTGKYRLGDGTDWRIYDWDASGVNVYENEGIVYSPPIKIDAIQQLDEVVVSPFPEHADFPWYFQKLGSSLTVLAGTFDDVLVQFALDKNFGGPTKANDEFVLDYTAVPYGVTHVSWMAAGIGEIQNRDYDEFGNMLFEYQLKATSVPLPPSLVLLGSGLLGLLALRKRFSK